VEWVEGRSVTKDDSARRRGSRLSRAAAVRDGAGQISGFAEVRSGRGPAWLASASEGEGGSQDRTKIRFYPGQTIDLFGQGVAKVRLCLP
jgi:hypothetical protein